MPKTFLVPMVLEKIYTALAFGTKKTSLHEPFFILFEFMGAGALI